MIAQSLRVVARGVRSAPGFAVTAVVALAVGIGLSTAVYTVAETMLLRQLPIRDQDRVVTLSGATPDGSFSNYPLTYHHARDFAQHARALEWTAFFDYYGALPTSVRDGDRLTRLRQALVSGNYFDALGVRPALGRMLRPEDDLVGAAPVAVLSHNAWQRLFGGDTGVLRRSIMLHGNGIAYSIVGVAPEGLDHPRGTEIWAPYVPVRTRAAVDSVLGHVNVIGRLRAGHTAANARSELQRFYQRPDASTLERSLRAVVNEFPRLIVGDTRPAVLAFAAAAALLLLITCINVANLLLVRGLARVREMAVRAALGADRTTMLTQLLVENAVLAIAGGALGVAVAAGAVEAFVAFAPADVPRLSEMRIDVRALAGAIGITSIAMLVFGLAPALATSRVQLQDVLRSGARESGSRRSRWIAESLVAGQVALAVLVLSASALVAGSFIRLQRAELAMEPSRLLIAELTFRQEQVATVAKQRALLDAIVPAVAAVPGVAAVSPVVAIPFAGSGGWDGRFRTETQTPEEGTSNPVLNIEVVAPEYFATVGIRLVRGRLLSDGDVEGAPRVVVISESTARMLWRGEDAIGKRLMSGLEGGDGVTVVGIVPDTRYRELRDPRPSVYFPLRQASFAYMPLNLAIRTTGAPSDAVPALRSAVAEAMPGVELVSAAPFETYMQKPLAQPRLNALLLAVFSAAAVVLAAIGLFGTMATMVRQRTREMGIRMALGATNFRIRRMVIGRGLAISAAGLAAGLGAAIVANRALDALLYDVTPTDPVTLVSVTVLVLGVVFVACLIPARTTTRITPVTELRSD